MTGWPPWAMMWMLAVTVYAGCKWVTWWNAAVPNVPGWKHAAYLLAWPGLDAASFLEHEVPGNCRCPCVEWFAAAGTFTCGVILLFGVARVVPASHAYLVGWIGMIGLVLILHFGIFQLLSCGWRSIGIEARPLMRRPLASRSLSEFWGRRWNTAFRDLTHQFLFRPFTARLGSRWGLLAGFMFSGVIHEVVISVPARGGYGGPTIFFALQGAAVVIERGEIGRRIGLREGIRGRLFALIALLAPISLLFHEPFVVGIVVPFMRALRAI